MASKQQQSGMPTAGTPRLQMTGRDDGVAADPSIDLM